MASGTETSWVSGTKACCWTTTEIPPEVEDMRALLRLRRLQRPRWQRPLLQRPRWQRPRWQRPRRLRPMICRRLVACPYSSRRYTTAAVMKKVPRRRILMKTVPRWSISPRSGQVKILLPWMSRLTSWWWISSMGERPHASGLGSGSDRRLRMRRRGGGGGGGGGFGSGAKGSHAMARRRRAASAAAPAHGLLRAKQKF